MNAQPAQVIEHEAVPARIAAPYSAITPMAMLDRAVEQGAGIEVLTKLMELQERWDRNQARKAFDNAMSAAKAEIPTISKNREVDFTSSKGRTNYKHEDLAEITRVVTPILGRHGLSYRFRTSSPVGEPVTVTCIVSHRDGYSEENTLVAGRDETGNKNSIQAVGSTITYLQRYTLKAALGLAASNDDDGKGSEATAPPISEEQVTKLIDLIESVGANRTKLLQLLKVESLDVLPVTRYDEVVAELKLFEERRKAKVAS
jgi:hypothetical protein